MKRYLFIALLFAGCAKTDPSQFSVLPGFQRHPMPSVQTTTPILVIGAGQSNMSGEYSGGTFPVDPMVTSVTGNRANRGYEFAILLAHKMGRNVVFLNCAVQGSAIASWQPGALNYANCLSQVNALHMMPTYFLFSQGETEAGYSTPSPWSSAFRTMIDAYRSSLGPFKVIYTQIGQFNASPQPPEYQQIKDEQNNAQGMVDNSVMVRTDDLTPNCGGGWHYCMDDEAIIAQRMIKEGI